MTLQALVQVSSDPDWSSLMSSSQILRAQTKRAVAQDQLEPLLDQLQACRALNSVKLSLIRNYYTILLVSLHKAQSCNMYKVCRSVSLFIMLCRPSAKTHISSPAVIKQTSVQAWKLVCHRQRLLCHISLFTYYNMSSNLTCLQLLFLAAAIAAASLYLVNSTRMTVAAKAVVEMSRDCKCN